MNIFEAVEAGKGKALYRGRDFLKVCFDSLINQFYWNDNKDASVSFEDLKRDDWTPYVSPEEGKIEGMLNFVPRGTCSNCGQAIPLPKVKPKVEVFEDVRWNWWTDSSIYPNIDIDKRHSFLNKPPMKMTLEWKE